MAESSVDLEEQKTNYRKTIAKQTKELEDLYYELDQFRGEDKK